MSSPESVVVIIVNYNTSHQVVNAIHSLVNESIKGVIVVDNASPKDNISLITDTFPSSYVTLLSNSNNVGFGEACNIGFKYAQTHLEPAYVVFLNPDTIVEPGIVKALLKPFEMDDVAITTPLITNMNDINKIWYSGGDFSWSRGSALVKEFGHLLSDTPDALIQKKVNFASGCCFMVRSNLFHDLGGFDSRYFMYEEDVEISLAFLKKKFSIVYVPTAIVRHIGQGSQGKLGESFTMYDPKNPKLTFFVYYTTRNRIFTVKKHGNIFQKLCFFIGFPLWIIRRGFPWLLNFRFDAFKALYKGLRDAIK